MYLLYLSSVVTPPPSSLPVKSHCVIQYRRDWACGQKGRGMGGIVHRVAYPQKKICPDQLKKQDAEEISAAVTKRSKYGIVCMLHFKVSYLVNQEIIFSNSL
jgi:hypothetical protein